MAILSLDQAQSLTRPFHDLWLEAHNYAEGKFWGYGHHDPEGFLALGQLSRANFLHDQVVRRISVQGAATLQSTIGLGFFAQVLPGDCGDALVRFKLLNDELRTSNHDSDQQDALDLHEYSEEAMGVLSLSGISGPPTLLTCGYQVKADESGISRVLIVCHYKRDLVYYYDVRDAAEGGGSAEVLLLPHIGSPPEATVRSRPKPEQETPESSE